MLVKLQYLHALYCAQGNLFMAEVIAKLILKNYDKEELKRITN